MATTDKKKIINELVNYYSHGNKADFARKLGITPQGLSTWINRNTFDVELIFSKCENLNAEWLLTGSGQMLKSEVRNTDTACALCVEKDRTISALTDQVAAKDEIIRLLKGGGKAQRSAPYSGDVSESRSYQPKK